MFESEHARERQPANASSLVHFSIVGRPRGESLSSAWSECRINLIRIKKEPWCCPWLSVWGVRVSSGMRVCWRGKPGSVRDGCPVDDVVPTHNVITGYYWAVLSLAVSSLQAASRLRRLRHRKWRRALARWAAGCQTAEPKDITMVIETCQEGEGSEWLHGTRECEVVLC